MTKSECRKYFSEKRSKLSDLEIDNLSQQIIDRLLNTFDFSNCTVSVFLPILSKKEIDTWKLLRDEKCRTVRFVVPVSDFETNTMRHVLVEQNTKFIVNRWGIPEPKNGKKVLAKDIDVVIVPLLAFDLLGFRVGYGKGFYDRFLASCRPDCRFIGLSFFAPIDRISDSHLHDIPLHFCITANKQWIIK